MFIRNVIYVEFIMDHTWFLEELDHFKKGLQKENKNNTTPPSFKRNRRTPNFTCWDHHWKGHFFLQLKKLGYIPNCHASIPENFHITIEVDKLTTQLSQMHPHCYIYIYNHVITLCIPYEYDFPAFRHDVSFSTGRFQGRFDFGDCYRVT